MYLQFFHVLTFSDYVQVNMNEKDYQRKKNKFLPKIHAWYDLFFIEFTSRYSSL